MRVSDMLLKYSFNEAVKDMEKPHRKNQNMNR